MQFRCEQVMITVRKCILFVVIVLCRQAYGQTAASTYTFIDYQRSFPRINEVIRQKEDTLMKQFRNKDLVWPARFIYIRSFKYDSQLEVWVKNEPSEKYKLFKTYKVCALAGSLGPKRMQGDYQVPEGFYYINEFNPNSAFHLSLGLNYPNSSDRILSDSIQPGGDIYIHGSCVTTGCIPITDGQIEELYILAAHARSEGQDFIPVHIFPIQFNNPRSVNYLNRYLKDFPEYGPMAAKLKDAYTYFDKTRQVPIVMVNARGRYVIERNGNPEPEVTETKPVKKTRARREFSEEELAKVVDVLPKHPEGMQGFQHFLDKLSKDLVPLLRKDQTVTYIMVEYIIDKNGKPAYARVLKGGNDELNEKLELAFEAMPNWTPAYRTEKPVAIRLKQSMIVERTK